MHEENERKYILYSSIAMIIGGIFSLIFMLTHSFESKKTSTVLKDRCIKICTQNNMFFEEVIEDKCQCYEQFNLWKEKE